MTPVTRALGHAVAAGRAVLAPPRVLRRAQVTAAATFDSGRLPGLPESTAARSLAVSLAPSAVAPALRRDAGVLRRVLVPVPATPTPGRAPSLILEVSDRVEALRVAAPDAQTRVDVVELESVRDRPSEVLPHDAVHGDLAPATTALADVAVARTAHLASPYPVPVDLLDTIEDSINQRTSNVGAGHGPSLLTARPVAARHALFCSVHDCGYPDPLSRSPRTTS